MLMWMLYVTAVGCVLGLAALLAEWALRQLGRPVRWAWAAALASTVMVPLGVAVVAAGVLPVDGFLSAGSRPASGVDTLLLAGWGVVTLVLLASLRLSAWTLRRNLRSWRSDVVEGQRVRLSTVFGPSVVGVRAPRVVLPAWVVGSPQWLRRLVVRHEREHVRAGDTALLSAGIVAAALVPWCVPLWWQLHRLRRAIETDCDARVLAAIDAPRAYANALVAIAGRPPGRLQPVPTLAPRAGELERRIRLITRSRPGSRRAGLGLLVAALASLLAAGSVPAPATLPAPVLPTFRLAAPRSSLELPREAKVILSVDRGAPAIPQPER